MTPKRKSDLASTKTATKKQKGPTPKELAQLHAKRRSMLDNITIWPERGVDVEPDSFPFLDKACKKRQWDKLFYTPADYHRKIVIDFYVALPDISAAGNVTVGGCKVPFTE